MPDLTEPWEQEAMAVEAVALAVAVVAVAAPIIDNLFRFRSVTGENRARRRPVKSGNATFCMERDSSGQWPLLHW